MPNEYARPAHEDNAEPISGRRIAVFPGAFQPPHQAHFEIVRGLAESRDFDEVVVVISNRQRPIPHTGKALDARTIRRVWTVFLKSRDDVRVEVARHTAVQHALDFFDRVSSDDSLTFCVGEADYKRGDDRFEDVGRLASIAGIDACVQVAPTASMHTRASDLRELLSIGEKGQSQFCSALPKHLSAKDRALVWKTCLEGMRTEEDVHVDKIRVLLADHGLEETDRILPIPSTDLRVYQVHRRDGRRSTIKCAGDSPNQAPVGQPRSMKPRKRLNVETRALRYLEAVPGVRGQVPVVEYFDTKSSLLMHRELSELICSVEDEIADADFSIRHAREAVCFLAKLRRNDHLAPVLRQDAAADRAHWNRLLASRADLACLQAQPKTRYEIKGLVAASRAAARPGLMHMQFLPQHFLIEKAGMRITEWGASTGFGDPAFDIASLLGRYLFHGLRRHSQNRECSGLISDAMLTYSQEAACDWLSIVPRIFPFAGMTMLASLTEPCLIERSSWHQRIHRTASALLSLHARRPTDMMQTLKKRDIEEQASG